MPTFQFDIPEDKRTRQAAQGKKPAFNPATHTILPVIQGRQAQSKPEVFLAQAFDELGIQYIFHYSLRGGTDVRGGQVVDFVVFNGAETIPWQVFGERYHPGDLDPTERFNLSVVEWEFQHAVIITWASTVVDKETAMAQVRKELRL